MAQSKEPLINAPELDPSIRHKTIFKAFEQLEKNESFIIHNNHDPLPVRFQLINLYGGIFTWTYTQQGPEWWDVRVTKTEEIE